jgi:hypothetical protein
VVIHWLCAESVNNTEAWCGRKMPEVHAGTLIHEMVHVLNGTVYEDLALGLAKVDANGLFEWNNKLPGSAAISDRIKEVCFR